MWAYGMYVIYVVNFDLLPRSCYVFLKNLSTVVLYELPETDDVITNELPETDDVITNKLPETDDVITNELPETDDVITNDDVTIIARTQ